MVQVPGTGGGSPPPVYWSPAAAPSKEGCVDHPDGRRAGDGQSGSRRHLPFVFSFANLANFGLCKVVPMAVPCSWEAV